MALSLRHLKRHGEFAIFLFRLIDCLARCLGALSRCL